ncbi:LacI family DNA-binding transcriptional regulator [Streptomyces sp. NRRL WC-3549]|uniref:LacI family DNA-binding transcriptional regulator n=1 Tax=Streptomyces sp. NRRL WC-3549 TaxID=1463925 RepID=UPI0004C61F37|nr:LacI family DNA-binding transcriptional regulator [Streptomyces sp. NRRL WC-3549]
MTDALRSTGAAPTLEDVARAAGVSRATVSRVINGVRNVDPAIQETVRQAVSVTGYTPNQAARSLVTRRTDAVALVVSGAGAEPAAGKGAAPCGGGAPEGAGEETGRGGEGSFTARVFADPFFGRVVTGVVDHLRPRGIHPVLMCAETSWARDEVVSYLRQGSADGALIVSTHAEDPLPGLVAEAGLPAVLYARPARPTRISYVDLAHRDGARLAAEHLLARGCRRIATISGPLDVAAGQDRLAGFQETMARHGHPYIPVAEGGFTQESGEAAMEQLLAGHPGLDGVFAGNDLMATGACHVLRDHGKKVPEDVAVVGFDDSGAAAACRPPLTEPERPATSVIFEPTLVVRASA